MNITSTNEHSRAALSALSDLRKYGVPAPVAKAQTDAQAIVERVTALTDAATPANLAALLTGLARGGKDRPTDEEVSTALVASAAIAQPAALSLIQSEASGQVVTAMREHADDLIEAMRPTFDQAVKDLDSAAAVLVGITDLADLEGVAQIGGDAAEQWKLAKAAEKGIQQIEMTLAKLARGGCYLDPGDPRERRLAILDAPFDGYRQVSAQTSPWTLRRLGTLSLATADQLSERVTRVNDEWAAHPDNPATRLGPGVGQFPVRAAVSDVIGAAL